MNVSINVQDTMVCAGDRVLKPLPRAHPTPPPSWVHTFCSSYSAVKTMCSKNKNRMTCSSYFERQADLVVWGQMGLV